MADCLKDGTTSWLVAADRRQNCGRRCRGAALWRGRWFDVSEYWHCGTSCLTYDDNDDDVYLAPFGRVQNTSKKRQIIKIGKNSVTMTMTWTNHFQNECPLDHYPPTHRANACPYSVWIGWIIFVTDTDYKVPSGKVVNIWKRHFTTAPLQFFDRFIPLKTKHSPECIIPTNI